MKRLLTVAAVLTMSSGAALAKQGDFSVGFGLGYGFQYFPKQTVNGVETPSGVKPGALDFIVPIMYEWRQNMALSLELLGAMNTSEDAANNEINTTTNTKTKAKIVGSRPGIFLYLGDDRGYRKMGASRLYLRAAVPLEYNVTTGELQFGFLVGAGLEFNYKSWGLWGEVLAVPAFYKAGGENRFYLPMEFHAGAILHF
ncbi:MAG: hypothetical protein HYY84_00010 [Deltaproteobacteria bacterium]|nr:hypothetical protein [Deltaproteobacteria bacterium]